MTRRVVLLGGPGAGKGTQARRVSAKLGMVHLSTGDLLRAAVSNGTAAGKAAKVFMDAGKLVPDEVVFGVLFENLEDGTDAFLLDGFPRNRAQATELDTRLAAADTPLERVIEIAVPDERLVGRITGRRICRACGNNHHVEFMRPATEGVCDACGGALYQREDDTEETVRQRVAVYHEQTAPLLEYYDEQGKLGRVDGDRAPDEVTTDLIGQLSAGVVGRS